ncbi:hypothetical protein Tco_1149793, partial [Tanacetum coccineum]
LQGLEASGALFKKRQKPKFKKPPIETKGQRLKGNIPPADMEPIHPTIADLSGTGANYQLQTFANVQAFLLSEDELDKESDEKEVLAAGEDIYEDPQVAEEVRTPSPNQDQPKPSHEQHEEVAVSYADLKASIKEYYDENVTHRDQTDKPIKTTMSTNDRRSTTIKGLYQGLNVITKLLKDINNDVKDDPATNKKIDEAIETLPISLLILLRFSP